ncbi:hypothetical protein JB92DRAFT_3016971 [Gautieria morchelliformis]|nr:hypothetical protein JB92DRAFT_3016971 [Gautieria morchelliformis]
MRQIQGDRLEQSRIRLERDIDKNIPSPPSMSSDNPIECGDDDDLSSVDFARHNAHPQASFQSFEHLSHLDSDFYSRHGDDDSIALDPDLGQTMSTAAHHASALTLSAGLRGRNSYNHTTGRASPSGAEFDPERPLQDMLDRRIANGISLVDATGRSKSVKSLKHDQTRSLPTFDPVVVDSTTELDRFLRTGHQHAHAYRKDHPYVPRSHSHPSPGVSDASDSDNSTPRISQALGQHFSPKRPRSAPISTHQSHPPPRPTNPTPSRMAQLSKPKRLEPGPSNLNPARHSAPERKSAESQFSKPARGIGRYIKAQPRLHAHGENRNQNHALPRPHPGGLFPSAPAAVSSKRPPFTDIVNKELSDAKPKYRTRASARIHLPDVTGLTAAVESPVKGGDGYAAACVAHPSLAMDLLPALDALQTRLQALERENGVSRRRVTELEFELEECKAEVAKECTRVRERELERDEEAQIERERERERHVRGRMREEESRYRAVVEEKKALEALVSTLRTHLARLTSELASHKSLIADLRADACASRETQAEVDALRAEVERLAGEVERLKEIVEEGLRERRRARLDMNNASDDGSLAAKDQTTVPAQVGIDLTYVTAPMSRVEEGEEHNEPLTMENLDPEPEQAQQLDARQRHNFEPMPRSRRFIDASELARVESEMRDRRLERSRSSSGTSSQADISSRNSVHDPAPDSVSNDQDDDPLPMSDAPRPTVQPSRMRRKATPPKQPPQNTPFPQIRGSRMERLFFSAPEHNARTCTVCHRRKRGEEQRRMYQPDDGYRDSEKDDEAVKAYLRTQAKRANREKRSGGTDYNIDGDGDGDRLPPQTVLARVVRELEDDFSHYKAIYLELAEQYGIIDAASNVAKRNVLADHLREVIDTLEQKGDQIASLYDLLNFQDKPLPRGAPSRPKYAAFA